MKIKELLESTTIKPHSMWALLFAIYPGSTVKLNPKPNAHPVYVWINPARFVEWNELSKYMLKLNGDGPETNTVTANLVSPKSIIATRDTKGTQKTKELDFIILNLEELDMDVQSIDVIKLDKKPILIHLLDQAKNDDDSEFLLNQIKELKRIVMWPELDAIEKSIRVDK